jgi:hypothetical protein
MSGTLRWHMLDMKMAVHGSRWPLCGSFGDVLLTADADKVDCLNCLRKLGQLDPPGAAIPSHAPLVRAAIAWHASYTHGGDPAARDTALCAAVDAYTAQVRR